LVLGQYYFSPSELSAERALLVAEEEAVFSRVFLYQSLAKQIKVVVVVL
jgi:hypothetical protein